MPSFPTLAHIDRARGGKWPPFADDPDAASLERLARSLTDAHWSERVWLTGLVSQDALEAVCRRLEQHRRVRVQVSARSVAAME